MERVDGVLNSLESFELEAVILHFVFFDVLS
jgi:hypothetical protein